MVESLTADQEACSPVVLIAEQDKEGAEQLSRITGRRVTLHAWRKQRQKMGISKMPGRGICRINYKQDGDIDVLN